jgi:RND family efflux transporter MFP subunit
MKCNLSPAFRFRAHALALALLTGWSAQTLAADLPAAAARASVEGAGAAYEGKVEAVRQAQIAAQVPGAVTELNVRAGDRVKANQVLLRIDARAAEQGASASGAQALAARAQLDVAAKEVARKRQLFDKHYISQAALDQAEAAYKAARAQADALAAQAGAAQTQTAFHVVRAPFDGVVSQVAVERGDMAMPGKPLLTVYDPAQLRVSAFVPVTALGENAKGAEGARVLLAGQPAAITPVRVQVLPTVDAASLTREVRADLPVGASAAPGLFARLLLSDAPSSGAAEGVKRLAVPRSAVVRRAEMTGLYVLDKDGAPRLRQVRLGAAVGDEVEILSGLDAGERVVTDPHAATRAAAAK